MADKDSGTITDATVMADADLLDSVQSGNTRDMPGSVLKTYVSDSPTLVTPLLGTPASGTLSNCDVASPTARGVVEHATIAEVDTASDADRVMSPAVFKDTTFGVRYASIAVFAPTVACSTGDGKAAWAVPEAYDGWDLVSVQADVQSGGVTGTMDIDLHELIDAVDMLSTNITIDTAELSSRDAVTPPVIDGANDTVNAGNQIRIDIDNVHSGTPADGLVVTLGFRKP